MERAGEHNGEPKVTTHKAEFAWEPTSVESKAALLLSRNVPFRETAKRCGVGLSTILRWTRRPEMRELIQDWRINRLQRFEDE